MIYELRVYRCLPGRLPALLHRFETRTLAVWQRFGIRQAGFWTTLVGPSHLDLTYMLVWESMAERESKWATFTASAEWRAALAEFAGEEQILSNISNSFLQPTSFSAVKIEDCTVDV